MSDLSLPKGKNVAAPKREPDLISKRGVPYWFSPEWVRATNSAATSFGRIRAIKSNDGSISLYMVSKEGSVTYIQGSIQREFSKWCTDQEIDCILLGVEMDDIIATDWEYE